MDDKPNIRCPKCGHDWKTKSVFLRVACPCCMARVKNPNTTVKISTGTGTGR